MMNAPINHSRTLLFRAGAGPLRIYNRLLDELKERMRVIK
jgi:hypothetical protein